VQTFPFNSLTTADLLVDAAYLGGRSANAGDDPLPKLLGVSNMGGFRYRGTLGQLNLLVLTSSLSDPDWPDGLDQETGVFTYYGDNKLPGRALHSTPRKGNDLLARMFDLSHEGPAGRRQVPPTLVFANLGNWRDVAFIGLAVPGTGDLRLSEDLVAIWKSAGGKRFQNYRAKFTILDVPVVSRAWIDDLGGGNAFTSNAPAAWVRWVRGGRPRPLLAARSVEHRSKTEQLPRSTHDLRILSSIHGFFSQRPHDFEACAASLARMLVPDITSLDLTRPSRDGGRDAIGQLRIGRGASAILVDFALEAKCYGPLHGVGVKEMSRLISRLRHRQFGILVTTSYVDTQAYREIKEDGHPIIVISGQDIVELLHLNGYGDSEALLTWLQAEWA
jgi:hypothetical protein